MPPPPPTGFIGTPDYGSQHPVATPISQAEDARAPYASRAAARLTVQPDGMIYLNAEAARLLPKNDGTADLRQPVRPGAPWHLDCRPGGLYQRLVGPAGTIRFRALARARLMLGCSASALNFEVRAVGNGLFELFTISVQN